MKEFYKAAAAGVVLLVSVTTLFQLRASGQPPDYLAQGEAALAAGDYDLARRDFSQAFQIAQQNGDAETLLRITNDFRLLLEMSMPPPEAVSSIEADVSGAYSSALDAAITQACYDPSIPGSGTNVAAGQANLRAIVGFYSGLFGEPNTSAAGLEGRLSYAALAAQSYLDASTAGALDCQPAPPPAVAPPRAPAPVPVPVPVVPIPAPSPTNTSEPEPTNTSEPEPTNTSEPEPTNTAEPEPTNTAGAAPA